MCELVSKLIDSRRIVNITGTGRAFMVVYTHTFGQSIKMHQCELDARPWQGALTAAGRLSRGELWLSVSSPFGSPPSLQDARLACMGHSAGTGRGMHTQDKTLITLVVIPAVDKRIITVW